MFTLLDFTPVLQALLAVLASVITGLVAIYLPRMVAAFETSSGVKVTDQERTAVYNSANTAIGIVEKKLSAGLIKASDVTPTNPTIVAEAAAAVARVPDSASAQKTETGAMAAIIASRVNTTPVSSFKGSAP